MHCRGSTSET
ncbi:hypothetical protein EYF80_068370 [Liparis tanakae]|uniref:Uncharacterized protein n=1 Tax=Liparis tanakae TaxID=230148 RepID=A0A4Z2DYL2_9TELE|nr:hypothetical protein EYF80_068370 [Liparis tanakae]